MISSKQVIIGFLTVLSVMGAANDLPSSGGYRCPSSKGLPPTCSYLGGNPGTGIPLATTPLGRFNTPARSANATGSAISGSRSVATGLSTVPSMTVGIFGDLNIYTRTPELRRTDGDNSSNGLFGLSVDRVYFTSSDGEGSDYSENTAGYTLLGPNWLMNYELYLKIISIGGVPMVCLRNSEGSIITFTQNETNTWNADPRLMAAKLVFIPGQLPDDENYTLKMANDDATYGFDTYGYLLYMEDRNGNRLTLTYTYPDMTNHPNVKKLDRVTASAPDNRYLQFAYWPPVNQYDPRTAHVKRITNSWDNKFVEYVYYDGSSPFEGQLQCVKDSFGRVVEEYDLSSGDIIEIKRPNGQGQIVSLATYGYEFDPDLPYWGGVYKRDGAGTPLLWGGTIINGGGDYPSFTDFWKDRAGLEIATPLAHSQHVYAPSQVTYRNSQDPSNPIPFKQLTQTPQDVDSTGQSMMPKEICHASGDGSGNDGLCQSYTYPDWDPEDPHDPDDFSFSKLEKIESPGELDTLLTYDPTTKRLKKSWQSQDRYTEYTYDSVGNVISVTQNGDYGTTYTLDSLGRVVTKTTPLGITTYLHDNWGHIREITDEEGFTTCFEYDSRGLKTAVGSRGTTTTYEYDSLDRLTTVTDHLGHKTVYAYNYIDQVISVTDPMNHTTQYEYSPTTGTLTSVTDPEGGVISYEYDLLGRMIKMTDQNDNSTTYSYDILGRVETETNPLNQTTSYTYDDTAGGCSSCGGGNGNLASVTDPAGRTTYYEYDDGDRLTTVTYSGSSDMVVHTYDEYGRRIMTFDNRLPVADFPTQTFTWTYDKFDRMLTETYPDGEQVAWTYDINGRRTSLTDPDGNETRSYLKTI